jgi:hypothetical protein
MRDIPRNGNKEGDVGSRARRTLALTALLCGLAAGAGAGCAFGPRVLERSYGPYYESVRHTDEEELLRNLVHIRYNESPGDLRVSSVAAQYELTGQAEARPFFVAPNPSNSNVIFRTFTAILPDVLVSGSNRPTVTLLPGYDTDALRQFLAPISGETLVFLAQTGWPVSTIIRLYVERLNGVPNDGPSGGPPCDGPPDGARFQRVAELLQAAADQDLLSVRAEERATVVGGPLPAEAVTGAAAVEAAKNGLEYRPSGDGKSFDLVRKERRLVLEVTPGAEGAPELAELFALLNLVPGQRRYDLTVATGRVPDPLRHPAPPSAELRATPRSTADVYRYLANGVEVPPEHLSCGLVRPAVAPDGHVLDGREVTRGLFEVHVADGHKPPPTAYVAVKYRGYWYYIDDCDAQSKTTFTIMLLLSRLDLRRQPPGGGPVLTLPAGR